MGQAKPLPGPDGLPLVGSFFGFVRDPFGFYDELRDHGDTVVGYTMMGYEMCSVLDPDAIEDVLLNDADAFPKPEMLGDSLGECMEEGHLLTEGKHWREQRTMIQPMFYRERIETYGDLMADYAAESAEGWAERSDVELQSAASDLTLRILARTLFDVDVDAYESEIRGVAKAIGEIGSAGALETHVPQWIPLPSRRRHQRSFEAFDDAMREVIEESRSARGEDTEGDGDDTDIDADDIASNGEDILSLLLEAEYPDGSAPSETEIRDQLMTFLFAGHETTALALTWAFVLLNRRPETYERLHAEVDAVLDGDRATLNDLPDLTYTDRVATETLRLRPPPGALFRETSRDVELGGYHVPEGTMLVLPQFEVQTDPAYFEDPYSFRPERWDGDLEDEIPDYAYFPFGGGPRHCIGMRFANLELRLALATIARNVEIDVQNPDVEADLGTPFEPTDDVEAVVRPR